jgi:hypothetical protein
LRAFQISPSTAAAHYPNSLALGADGQRIRRVAPLEFIGRYMDQWFDHAYAMKRTSWPTTPRRETDWGTLAASAHRTVTLTGTLLGGYASDLYNLLFRLEPGKMVAQGYEWGESGLRSFLGNLRCSGKGDDHRGNGE